MRRDPLRAFLAHHDPVAEGAATTGDGHNARVRSYVSDALPPSGYVTGVRSLVARGDRVLVREASDGIHLLHGADRRDVAGDETVRETLEQVVGCAFSRLIRLGFTHLHQVSPKAPDQSGPYPDSCQVVFGAELGEEGQVERGVWAGLDEIHDWPLPMPELAFLDRLLVERAAGD